MTRGCALLAASCLRVWPYSILYTAYIYTVHESNRMLEHYPRIRIGAKRQALDALDAARRGAAGNGTEKAAIAPEIETVVEASGELTPQPRHSLRLSGSPPSGKLLIPTTSARDESRGLRRDVSPERHAA